jgi:hypothetical protein
MPADLFDTATEHIAVEFDLTRGVFADIVSVGMYLTTDPAEVPLVSEFVPVVAVDGTGTPPLPPLAEAGKMDIVAKVGPGGGAVTAGHFNFSSLTAPETDHQVWTLITTATEHIIRRPDVLTIKAGT